MIERFTRVSESTINYEFTVEDPLMRTRPWSGEVPFNRLTAGLRIRCHEGNYALENGSPGRGRKNEGSRTSCARTIGRFWRRRSAAGGGGRALVAHHAFGAEFDRNKPVRLQGKVVKLEWVNPHAMDPSGDREGGRYPGVWAVEGGTPNVLLRRGLRRDCLEPGTEIIVDGYQAKDHSLKRAIGVT